MLTLEGQRVVVWGRLGGMPKRELQQLLRQRGAVLADRFDASATLAVIGEAELPGLDEVDSPTAGDSHEQAVRQAVDAGTLQAITETQLWRHVGLLEDDTLGGDTDEASAVRRLYTLAMLADLLKLPVAVIRRWHRRGLIVPAHEVRKLLYFDFQEITTARRLAELVAAGVSPAAIEQKLAWLSRFVPGASRPLAQLSVLVEGRQLLLRQGEGLIEPGGQWRFNFDAAEDFSAAAPRAPEAQEVEPAEVAGLPPAPAELVRLAEDLEDQGELSAAVEMYRAALAAAGPQADLCFRLAELLYGVGQTQAACERYYMAVELDEDFVEARANLGCLLAELGQPELAVSAFQGALEFHRDYPDAHYHLARTLCDLGRPAEAAAHWQAFLRLAPDSPWADEARQRLSEPAAALG